MKKRICALTAVLILALSMSVSAVAPRITYTPSLTFSGTTANCEVDISANSISDRITATVKLWHGSSCLETWSDSGTGYLFFSESYDDVEVGERYTMTVDYTVAGRSYPTLSVSATCRG